MRPVRITFTSGDAITTDINGTLAEIYDYYMGQNRIFNFGDTDSHPADDLQRAVSVEVLDLDPPMCIAYVFPNGFREQATAMYADLRYHNLTPKWAPTEGGDQVILLSASDLLCLRLMQKHNPARFGNPPEGWHELLTDSRV